MINHRFPNFLLFGLFLFLTSGCAYPISKELRQEASKELTFPTVLQNPTAYVGSIVIWGGKIIETHNVTGGSEIIVLETPLDYQEMPESEKYSHGRFIAKSSTFLDPEVIVNRRSNAISHVLNDLQITFRFLSHSLVRSKSAIKTRIGLSLAVTPKAA